MPEILTIKDMEDIAKSIDLIHYQRIPDHKQLVWCLFENKANLLTIGVPRACLCQNCTLFNNIYKKELEA